MPTNLILRPCPDGDKELVKLLQTAVADLTGSSGRRPELTGGRLEVAGGTPGEGDLLVGQPQEILNKTGTGRDSFPAILILFGCQWDDAVRKTCSDSRISVECILRGDHLGLEKTSVDCSEMARLQEAILSVFRRRSRLTCDERAISKPVDWKARLGSEDSCHAGFFSFFADPDMRGLLERLKSAVLGLKSSIQPYEAELRRLRKLTVSPDRLELKNLVDENKEFRTKVAGKIPSVLLLGESGVGKSLVAAWITESLFGDFDPQSYCHSNISAIARDMVEAHLFGHIKGAFTHALADNFGLFLANRGKVVFLDEIGDMNPDHQVRLLTFLDLGTVRPIGWTAAPLPAPLVVVAATNRPLKEWIASGEARFRSDLFFRFQHVVEIPPLRERTADRRLMISLLLQDPSINPIRTVNPRSLQIERITLDAIESLERAEFHGNVRQLQSVLRDGVARAIAAGDHVLCLRHLEHLIS